MGINQLVVKTRNSTNQRGFTLMEFLIYIGITIVVLMSSVTFAWTIMNDRVKQDAVVEATDGCNFVIDKISYYTKRSASVSGSTVYGTNPGKLVLTMPDASSITFDTYTKSVMKGEVSVNIKKARLQVGAAAAVDLISDDLNVMNFVINDWSNTKAVTLKFLLTINTVNPSSDITYEGEKSCTISITKRKR